MPKDVKRAYNDLIAITDKHMRGDLDYQEFNRLNRKEWDAIEAAGLRSGVLALLRRDTNLALAGKPNPSTRWDATVLHGARLNNERIYPK